ncbi:MAG: hypothetical protein M3083_23020 [Actinomycetota bacterium]|nr:hypothetical protein [Actinomycetota bacterium]MDQ6948597.1 hypothetical protein [Actinomycetota bacterium]
MSCVWRGAEAVNDIGATLMLRNNRQGVEAIGTTVGNLVVSDDSGPGPYPGTTTVISGNIVRSRP